MNLNVTEGCDRKQQQDPDVTRISSRGDSAYLRREVEPPQRLGINVFLSPFPAWEFRQLCGGVNLEGADLSGVTPEALMSCRWADATVANIPKLSSTFR